MQDIPLTLNKAFEAGKNSTLGLDPLFTVDDGMYRYLHYIDVFLLIDRTTADTTGVSPARLLANLIASFSMKAKGFELYNAVTGQQIMTMYLHRAGKYPAALPPDLADNETDTSVLQIRIMFADPATGGDDTAVPIPWLQKTARFNWGVAADLGTGVTLNDVDVIDIVARVEDCYEARTPRSWTIEAVEQTTDSPVLPKGDYRAALIFDTTEDISSAEVTDVNVPSVFEFPETAAALVGRWNADYAEDDAYSMDPAAPKFIPILFLPYPRRFQSNHDAVGTPDAGLQFKISGTLTNPTVLAWYFRPTNRKDRENEFRQAYPYINIDKDGGSHVLKAKTRSGKLLSLDDRAALNIAWKAKVRAVAASSTAATKHIKG